MSVFSRTTSFACTFVRVLLSQFGAFRRLRHGMRSTSLDPAFRKVQKNSKAQNGCIDHAHESKETRLQSERVGRGKIPEKNRNFRIFYSFDFFSFISGTRVAHRHILRHVILTCQSLHSVQIFQILFPFNPQEYQSRLQDCERKSDFLSSNKVSSFK